jgi:acetolactate synthase-1/2/3 large subunit
MRQAADEITKSKKPVMICGQGCVHSGAWDAIKNLAEQANVLVGSSINAKGVFPETHPLSLGVIGARGGREWANKYVLDADLILFAGTSTDSAETDGWKLPSPKSVARMIQIDASEGELGNNYRAIPLLGDASDTLGGIAEMLPDDCGKSKSDWIAQAARDRKAYERTLDEFEKSLGDVIHPYMVSRVLERVAPKDAFFAIDPGISAVYPAAFMRLEVAGRRTAFNFAMGALGYAIPSGIGAKIGLPDRKLIALIGDGSFGFAAGELETAVRLGIDITYILFDNRSFGWIRGTEFVTRKSTLPASFGRFTDFAEVDYIKIAEGFGLKGFSAASASEFEAILKRCLAEPGAKLIALTTEAEDKLLPPVPGWYKYAKSAGMENLYGAEGIKA